MNRNVRLFAERVAWSPDIHLHFFDPLLVGHDKARVVTALEWTEINKMDRPIDNTGIPLSENQAQVLMDQLWDCGIRPSEGSGSAGSLLATQNHLKDVQAHRDGLIAWIAAYSGKSPDFKEISEFITQQIVNAMRSKS